jgi:hypothetical protein
MLLRFHLRKPLFFETRAEDRIRGRFRTESYKSGLDAGSLISGPVTSAESLEFEHAQGDEVILYLGANGCLAMGEGRFQTGGAARGKQRRHHGPSTARAVCSSE